MNINFFNILIISGITHGIIFSLVVLFNKKYRTKSSPYLALVVLFLSFHNLYFWIGDTGLNEEIPNYSYIYVPWNLLILPMYYFFVQSYLQTRKKYRIYYLLPFFISLVIHLYQLVMIYLFPESYIENSRFNFILYITEEYASSIFAIFVIAKTFYLIRQKEKREIETQNKLFVETNWLKKLLFAGVLICCFWIFLTSHSQSNQAVKFENINESNQYLRYVMWISISILIYWLGYLGVHHGLVFKQRKILKQRISKNPNTQSLDKNPRIEKIKQIIEEEKLFLDPSLNTYLVSKKLEMNEKYFSRIFNQNSSESFSLYINNLRVSEAKKLLIKEEYRNYTIIAIGLESGFNSKSAFYRVFKEKTGVTPSEFRKRNLSHF